MNPWFGVAIMATVTHLMRAVPLLAIRRRITNQWMLSFLHHLPYAVLSAMAFPAVLTDAPSSTTGLVALGGRLGARLARPRPVAGGPGAALAIGVAEALQLLV